jgi:TonB family protein
MRVGLLGSVELEFLVNAEGHVRNPTVISSNNPWYERPAIDAILQWKFEPGQREGRAVEMTARQVIGFDWPSTLAGGVWTMQKERGHDNLPLELRWDDPPLPTATNFPVYPADAFLTGRSGRAVVRFVVDHQGRADPMKVVDATAPEFGEAAMASVATWRFKPAMRAGVPCSASIQLEYSFDPSGSPSVLVTEGMEEVGRELSRKNPQVFEFTSLDEAPRALSRRAPVYPMALRRAGQPGEAVIEFFIDKEGDAVVPRIVSATATEFGFAAAQAVAVWRFEPPRKGGKAVITRVKMPISFKVPVETKLPDGNKL